MARSETVRADYAQFLEEVTSWLHRTEAKIRDGSAEPHVLKSQLQGISAEVGPISEKMEQMNKNGQVLVDKSQSTQERELVNSTCNNTTEQFSHLRRLLEQKKVSVGEAIDSWQKFLDLHRSVLSWAAERKAFCEEPLDFPSLSLAKNKLQEYFAVGKSLRSATKSLQEMSRELNKISQIGETADLGEKLHEAEQEKGETEALINEKVQF